MGKVHLLSTTPHQVCLQIAEAIDGRPPEDIVFSWPEGNEYMPAGLATEIAQELIGRVDRFADLADHEVIVLYRNKSTWKQDGETQVPTGLLQYFSAASFVIVINWHAWMAANPWQRVAEVYHRVRECEVQVTDSGLKTVKADPDVFFDELAVFGVDTFVAWRRLAQGAGRAEDVRVQYHPPLEEAATATE